MNHAKIKKVAKRLEAHLEHDYDKVSGMCIKCGDILDDDEHRTCFTAPNVISIGHRIIWKIMGLELIKAINKAP
jgi:hypothetical protein